MTPDAPMREFLDSLPWYGFQVHETADTFQADVIPPEKYGTSPLLEIEGLSSVSLLFWYNYPKAPILDRQQQVYSRKVSAWQVKAVLRTLSEYVVKHGLDESDTGRFLSYYLVGGKESEVQSGFSPYSEATLIEFTAMRHIQPDAMAMLLSGHLPVEDIRAYDQSIAPDIYLGLFPIAEMNEPV